MGEFRRRRRLRPDKSAADSARGCSPSVAGVLVKAVELSSSPDLHPLPVVRRRWWECWRSYVVVQDAMVVLTDRKMAF